MMRWQLKQIPEDSQFQQLAEALTTSSPPPAAVVAMLLQRGITSYEEAEAFFSPHIKFLHDPFLMRGMDQAVARLVIAHQKKEKIVLLGDYDVDGTTAVSLAKLCLDSYGFDCSYYIPDRYTEGYGVSMKGIDTAHKRGARLMISMDCGIKAIDKVAYAREKGIDFIICDHHTPGPELPNALAILDPKQPLCTYPFKELTGCGIILKLLQALHRELFAYLKEAPPEDPIASYADLVALSIASDIVPIKGENRILAYEGIKKIEKQSSIGNKSIDGPSPTNSNVERF